MTTILDDDDVELFPFTAALAAPTAPVITSSRRPVHLAAAWTHWCTVTERPKSAAAERAFIKLLGSRSRAECLLLLDLAAVLPPVKRDPLDLRRLRNVVEQPKHRAVAAAQRAAGAAPQPFPRPEPRSTLAALEAACGSLQREWSTSEYESAVELVTRYTALQLAERAQAACLRTGLDVLWPSDLVKHGGGGKVVVKAGRSTYGAGASESATTAEVSWEADPAAERKLIRGASAAEVAAYHAQAPAGYWAAVLTRLDEDRPLAAIYAELRATYAWHPGDRA